MIDIKLRSHRFPPLATECLITFLAFDLLLILVFVVAKGLDIVYGFPAPNWTVLGGNSNLASIWNYAKYFLIIAIALAFARQGGRREMICMAALFVVLLYDDYFEFHEFMGGFAGNSLATDGTLGLRAQDFGELLGVAILFALSVFILFVGFRRAASENRSFVKRVLFLVLALGVFGVGFDMVHEIVKGVLPGLTGHALNGIFSILEEGGELVVSSLMLFTFLNEAFEAVPLDPVRRRMTEAPHASRPDASRVA